MFVDSARISVRAGRGGNGCVSFRREKFVPRGGPNGGDGGRGGDVVLRVEESFNTLLHIHNQRTVRAEPGRNGQGSNKTGGGGADTVVPVPPGTVIRNAETLEVIGDLVEAGQQMVVALGGRGGRGNARFASSTNRAPRRADAGGAGEERELLLELKLMAEVGLIGLPNAGKSTLLARISAARPKIADYPFTTLEPHLGVAHAPGDPLHTLVVADIPGLIEGAHRGAGLGLQFLRHVERCLVLTHLVDLAREDAIEDRVASVRAELAAHSQPLDRRPWLLVGTKLDAISCDRDQALDELAAVADRYGVPWRAISAVSGEGVDALVGGLCEMAKRTEVGG